MKIMKTVISAILFVALPINLAACGVQNDTESRDASMKIPQREVEQVTNPVQESVTGGWKINQGELTPDQNPDALSAFEKATKESNDQIVYEPIAFLGRQVVAGTNYRFLCRVAGATPDTSTTYEIVTVYEDTDGNAEIISVDALSGLPKDSDDIPDTWSVNTGDVFIDTNSEFKTALETALTGLSEGEL